MGQERTIRGEDLIQKRSCILELKVNQILELKKLDSNKKISEMIKCESNDIADIRKKIKKNTSMQIIELVEEYLKNQCLDKLYETNKIKIPNSLLDHKDHQLKNKEEIEALKKKVTIELLIKEIIKKEKIKKKKKKKMEKQKKKKKKKKK